MKHHWKQLKNPDYLGAWDFQEGEVKITIVKDVKQDEVYDPKSRTKEDCTTVSFSNGPKPLILNTTNAKAISKIVGSPYVEDWIGKSIPLQVELVKAFNEIVPAVRVSTLPILTVTNEKYKDIAAAIKAKKATIEQVKNRFVITKEIEDGLLKLV